MITATEAGAIVAFYSVIAARFFYRSVSWRQLFRIAYESAILTAAVIFLLAVATDLPVSDGHQRRAAS